MKRKPEIPCYHCGDDCGNIPLIFDDKPFCCNGCKTVYEILNSSGACNYYGFEEHPGIRVNTAEIGNKYAFLDNAEIKNELLEFSDGGISKVKFFIPAIHCSSCIWLLENLHRLHNGIVQSMVHFVKKEVNITYKEQEISLRKVVELLASIHYIPQISPDDLRDS